MGFAADVTKFCEKTKITADTLLKKLALDAFRGVIMRSPVDTGRFRGSWRIGINVTDLSTEPEVDTKSAIPSGSPVDATQMNILSTNLQNAHFGDMIIISNNLPYAVPLEEGHSQQAPQGVMMLTFMELTNSLERALASVSKS